MRRHPTPAAPSPGVADLEALLKAIVQVRAHTRKDGSQVRAHTRTIADTAAIVEGLAQRLKHGEAIAHATAGSALTLARHASTANGRPAFAYRHPAGHWVATHDHRHLPHAHHRIVASGGKATLTRPGQPPKPLPETPPEVAPLDHAPPAHVHRELVGSGSTGEVYREGQEVVKQAQMEHGAKDGVSVEGQVYAALAGTPGIAAGRQEGRQIRLPWYPAIVSVDAVKPGDRAQFAVVVRPNVVRINQAVSALSERGYYYADPLQFGMRDGHMDLLDFSNVHEKPVDSATDNPRDLNLNLLSLFYGEFGLPDEGRKVGVAGRALKAALYFEKNKGRNLPGLFVQIHGEPIKGQHERLLDELQDEPPRCVYYGDAAPEGLPAGAAHVEVDGVHVVLSGKPLPPEAIARGGLTPLVHPAKA